MMVIGSSCDIDRLSVYSKACWLKGWYEEGRQKSRFSRGLFIPHDVVVPRNGSSCPTMARRHDSFHSLSLKVVAAMPADDQRRTTWERAGQEAWQDDHGRGWRVWAGSRRPFPIRSIPWKNPAICGQRKVRQGQKQVCLGGNRSLGRTMNSASHCPTTY